MASPDSSLRVAILGASGIGEVHARIMHSLGAQVVAILGSTNSSASRTADHLSGKYDFRPNPYSDLETLLINEKPEAISICTPPEHHFLQLKSAFEKNLPVLCEKPLLWKEGITNTELKSQLDEFKNYPGPKLLVNTSNCTFLDRIKDRIDQTALCQNFYFQFHTQGPHQGRKIAIDLLPHGLSFLIKLLGSKKISFFSEEYNNDSYKCQFTYGICKVIFDFQEDPLGKKALSFKINGRSFTRIQQGEGATYNVFLKDHLGGEKIKIKDPFQVYISRFLAICKNFNSKDNIDFDESVLNLKLMAEIILKKNYVK